MKLSYDGGEHEKQANNASSGKKKESLSLEKQDKTKPEEFKPNSITKRKNGFFIYFTHLKLHDVLATTSLRPNHVLLHQLAKAFPPGHAPHLHLIHHGS